MARALCVGGLGFGDCSKGGTVDKLCRSFPVDTVIRYGGGCQAKHHVVLGDGTVHGFSQFGSGTLANNTVKTHLSRFMLIEPFAMMAEADKLRKMTGGSVWERTTVDGAAVIITPFHWTLNQLRERARGANRHGSCGRGVGVARELHLKHGDEVLLARDLSCHKTTVKKLEFVLHELLPEITDLENRLGIPFTLDPDDCKYIAYEYRLWPAKIVDGLQPAELMVFEGAQGFWLDEHHGIAPHNTWTDTTFNNANTLLDEVGVSERLKIGCLRTYHTRHGAGPFPTEDNNLDLPEPHNGTGEFQGAFRVGRFDFDLAEAAIKIIGGVDYLALSHMDYLPRLGWGEDQFLEAISLFPPVGMFGRGPTADHRMLHLGMKMAAGV